MQSGFQDSGRQAEVVPLAALPETRKDARTLAAECPGWRCWYSPRAGLWFGKLADIDEPEDPRLVWLCDSDDQ
jgi:hypothetical protein